MAVKSLFEHTRAYHGHGCSRLGVPAVLADAEAATDGSCLVRALLGDRHAGHLLTAWRGCAVLGLGVLGGAFDGFGNVAADRGRGVHHALLLGLLGYVSEHAAT